MLGKVGLFKNVKDTKERVRKAMNMVLAGIGTGIDPSNAKKARKEEAEREQVAGMAGTFLEQAKLYFEYKAGRTRPKTLYEIERCLIGMMVAPAPRGAAPDGE